MQKHHSTHTFRWSTELVAAGDHFVKYRVRTALGCGFRSKTKTKTRRVRKQQYNAMQNKKKKRIGRYIHGLIRIKQTQER
jgi:hypothetical protein